MNTLSKQVSPSPAIKAPRCIPHSCLVITLRLIIIAFCPTVSAQDANPFPGPINDPGNVFRSDPNKSNEPIKTYRTFTNSEGRSVEARMVSVLDGETKIELKNGGNIVTWPATAFSLDDQAYMAKWATENISYRFAIRQDTSPNSPRKPISGRRYPLALSNGAQMTVSSGSGDDDSEPRYIVVSVANGSSSALANLEVAVWVILNRKHSRRNGPDSAGFAVHSGIVRLPKELGERQTVELSGRFTVEKKRLKEMQITTVPGTGSGFTSMKPVIKYKHIGSIRETLAGVLVRLYHDGKVVDEMKHFDSLLRSSDFKTDFGKPAYPERRGIIIRN